MSDESEEVCESHESELHLMRLNGRLGTCAGKCGRELARDQLQQCGTELLCPNCLRNAMTPPVDNTHLADWSATLNKPARTDP